MKIIVDRPYPTAEFIDRLDREFPDIDFVRAYTPDDQRRHIADADVFYGWPDAELIAGADQLRWIHIPGMGIDRFLDTPGAEELQIAVTNSPGAHTNPIADHVLAMILAFAHRLPEMIDDRRARAWDVAKYSFRILELNGSVLGLLGLGGIGRAVAERAMSFGMQVYAVDPSPIETPAGVRGVWDIDRLDELLGMADWFVVTAPLIPETRGLVDAGRVAAMKEGAHLIVISRGGIVDEAAVAEALSSGRLAGVGLDATEIEPLPADSPLWDLDNVILSPHVSGDTTALARVRERAFLANLRRFIDGEPLAYVVDLRRGY